MPNNTEFYTDFSTSQADSSKFQIDASKFQTDRPKSQADSSMLHGDRPKSQADSSRPQLDSLYHHLPTHLSRAELDRYHAPKQQSIDVVQEAINRARPNDAAVEPLALSPTEKIKNAAQDAEAARNRLAQEALLANPAEMRKLFPTLLKDVSQKEKGYLDLGDIYEGLENDKLPQTEKNFLTVLEKGYNQFCPGVRGKTDYHGISAKSLAIIDKALNRKIAEDPVYSARIKQDLIKGPLVGVTFAVFTAGKGAKSALYWAVGTAAVTTLLLIREDWADKGSEREAALYDKIAQDYKKFAGHY